MYKATEDICLTQDRQRAVPSTHPEAFSLLVAAGSELTDEESARYGLQTVAADVASTNLTTSAPQHRIMRKRVSRQA